LENLAIYPLCYFAPIPWYAAAVQAENLLIEVSEHYRKQQYTNRMRIKTTNAVLSLVVPVQHGSGNTPIRDKRISYDANWQKQHWKSLETAYRASPYFEYYEDKLRAFYEKKYDFLLDLNLEIHAFCSKIFQLNLPHQLTETYEYSDHYQKDFRNEFDASGKSIPEWFEAKKYFQVFDNENFTPALSILDLILNEGPHGKEYLLNGVKKA
jgi:hypothetical protein